MPGDPIGRQYRDENLASRYPFADTAGLATRDGLAFGADWLLDASVGPLGGPGSPGITSVVTAPGSATVWVGDADVPRRASATFDPAAPPALAALSDAGARPAGLLVLDPVAAAALQGWPAGTHQFADGAAAFVASCVVPSAGGGLLGLVEAGGTALADEAWLVGEAGVVLTGDAAAGTIRIDVVGDPLSARRACSGADGLPSGPFVPTGRLRRINGIKPDVHGAFVFAALATPRGSTIFRVTTEGDDTLVFSLAGPSGIGGA